MTRFDWKEISAAESGGNSTVRLAGVVEREGGSACLQRIYMDNHGILNYRLLVEC